MMEHKFILTGLETECFNQAIHNLQNMDMIFRRQFDTDTYAPWQATSYEQNISIAASSRLATPSKFVGKATTGEEVMKGFDPKGILADRMRANNLVCLDENRIHLFSVRRDGKTVDAEPNHFRSGDLVEAQLSLLVIKNANRKFQMKVLMRSMLLINDTHTNVSLNA